MGAVERHYRKLEKRLKARKECDFMNPAPRGQLNWHDTRVLLFHLLLVFVQGGLVSLKVENFGPYTPYVVMGINFVAEILRRLVY